MTKIIKRYKSMTGHSSTPHDKMYNAMPPGKRKTASGHIYYERRKNRADLGKNL
jgi:hypothetical protein